MTHPAARIKLTDMQASERAAAPPRRQLDLATFLGLIGGFGLMIAAMALGGSPTSFLDLPAALIVFGGTFAVTTVGFSLGDIARTQKAVALAMFRAVRDPRQAAEHVLELAQLARNQGVLVLERQLAVLNTLPFLRRALSIVVDGAAPEEVEHVMHQEMLAIVQRHQKSASVLRRQARPQLRRRGAHQSDLPDRGGLDRPAGESAPPGNADQRLAAAGQAAQEIRLKSGTRSIGDVSCVCSSSARSTAT